MIAAEAVWIPTGKVMKNSKDVFLRLKQMDLLQNSKCRMDSSEMLLWKARRGAMKMGMVFLNMFLLKMERMERMERMEIVKNNQKA